MLRRYSLQQTLQVRVQKEDIKVLKGQKTVGAKFTYDNMAVGKLKKEEDYIKKKKLAKVKENIEIK